MGKYLRISSYIRKPFLMLHSEFPYLWGKFYFLFYQCTFLQDSKSFQRVRHRPGFLHSEVPVSHTGEPTGAHVPSLLLLLPAGLEPALPPMWPAEAASAARGEDDGGCQPRHEAAALPSHPHGRPLFPLLRDGGQLPVLHFNLHRRHREQPTNRFRKDWTG